MSRNKITAIVPAYNEEERITAVLEVLSSFNGLDEIMVVDDGSTDATTEVVSRDFPHVKLVVSAKNGGKGAAMQKGLETSDADVMVFIDADLVGLNHQHLKDMITALDKGEADMTVGIFSSGRLQTDLSHKVFPFVSGQRGVTRRFSQGLPDLSKSRYGVEYVLSKYAKEANARVLEVPLLNATHVMKEEKLGWGRGFWARMLMYKDIVAAFLRHRTQKANGNRS